MMTFRNVFWWSMASFRFWVNYKPIKLWFLFVYAQRSSAGVIWFVYFVPPLPHAPSVLVLSRLWCFAVFFVMIVHTFHVVCMLFSVVIVTNLVWKWIMAMDCLFGNRHVDKLSFWQNLTMFYFLQLLLFLPPFHICGFFKQIGFLLLSDTIHV